MVGQVTHRRAYPEPARVRNEEVATYPPPQALLPVRYTVLFVQEAGVDLHVRSTTGEGPSVKRIGFPDRPAQNLDVLGHEPFQCGIKYRVLAVLRRVHRGHPASAGQVPHEAQPSLHRGAPGRGPVVADDQNALHAWAAKLE